MNISLQNAKVAYFLQRTHRQRTQKKRTLILCTIYTLSTRVTKGAARAENYTKYPHFTTKSTLTRIVDKLIKVAQQPCSEKMLMQITYIYVHRDKKKRARANESNQETVHRLLQKHSYE